MLTEALHGGLPHVALLVATGFWGLLRVHNLRWLRIGSFVMPSLLLVGDSTVFVVIDKPKLRRLLGRRSYVGVDAGLVTFAELFATPRRPWSSSAPTHSLNKSSSVCVASLALQPTPRVALRFARCRPAVLLGCTEHGLHRHPLFPQPLGLRTGVGHLHPEVGAASVHLRLGAAGLPAIANLLTAFGATPCSVASR